MSFSKLAMIMLALILIGLSGAALLLPIAHAAGPWYVAVSGNDGNDCLFPSTPCATINGAIGKANSGDTIYIAAGVYTNATGSEVVLLDKSLVISGGWDASFAVQNSFSIVDGEQTRRGISVNSAVTVTAESLLVQNGLAYSAAGISNSGTLTLTHSIIRDNVAQQGPGGILNRHSLTLYNSTVSGNRAFSTGGIQNNSDAVSMILNNTTVSGNTAPYGGGGISNYGPLSLNSVSIINNRGSGGYYTVYNRLTVQNTIIAENSGAPDVECYYGNGIISSLGYNLVGTVGTCHWTLANGDQLNADPKVGPLEGLPGFHRLLPDSPALNVGNPDGCMGSTGLLTADQRGLPRFGRCDIGAYEMQPFAYSLASSAMTVSQSVVLPGGSVAYSIILTNSTANIISTAVVTDTLPSLLSYNGLLSCTSGTAAFDNGSVTWVGAIGAGETITITFGATVSQDASVDIPIANSASVSGEGDSFTLNANVTPIPLAYALGSSAMTVSQPGVFRGSSVTYSIVLTNSIADAIPNIIVTDTLPSLLSYNGLLSSTSGTAIFDNGSVTWTGAIGAGETITITFGASVSWNAPLDIPIANSASVSKERDSLMLNANVTPVRSLVAAKIASTSSVLINTPITYTVTLTNVSSIPFPAARLTDTLPSQLAYADYVASTSGTAFYNNGTITWSGSVEANSAVTVSYTTVGLQVGPVTNSVAISEGTDTATHTATVTLTPRLVYVYLPLCMRTCCMGTCSNFFDDFSDPASGWPVGEDSDVRFEYLNGEYRILNKDHGYLFRAPTCTRQNYVVEADARWAGNTGYSYGLVFGVTKGFSQYYLFEINADYQGFGLYRVDASGDTQLVPPTYSPAIRGGTASNHLKVTRIGSQITLEVNGSVLGTWTDGTIMGLTSSGLASLAYSDVPNADARFDNFRVTSLAGSESTAAQNMSSQNNEIDNSQSAPMDRMPKPNSLSDWTNISKAQP